MTTKPIRDEELLATLVGCTIVAVATAESGSGSLDEDWLGDATLTLDDGRRINFNGWGHDWWGLNVTEETP